MEKTWKPHIVGRLCARVKGSVPSFRNPPPPRRLSLHRPLLPPPPGSVCLAVLTASLIKSLREARKRSRLFCSRVSSPRSRERPWPLRGAEIAVLRLAREDELDSLVNHSPFDDIVCACYPPAELGKRDFQRQISPRNILVDRFVDTVVQINTQTIFLQ